MASLKSRDNSSDSDISQSDWAVVDEDSSLEWNDEAKYHFRHSKVDADVLSNDASDEDSIEVVSDVDVIEGGEEDLEGHPDQTVSVISDDAEALDSPSNMVWYRLRNTKGCHRDCKSMQGLASSDNMTAVNPRDNWDLIVILVVALIGGIALGYFWGLRHEHAASSKTLTTKLQFENNLLRHKLRCVYLTLKYRTPRLDSPVIPEVSEEYLVSLKSAPVDTQYAERLETNIIPLELLLNESFAQELFPKDETAQLLLEMEAVESEDPKRSSKAAGELIKTDVDDDELASVEEIPIFEPRVLEDNILNQDVTMPDTDSLLYETVATSFSLLSLFDTNNSLSLSFNILENIGQNLQAIDSIQLENIPPKLYAKFSSIKLQTHKASNKLVMKVDKYVHKLSSKIFRKLQKFKTNYMKNFCNLKQIVESGNSNGFSWPEEMTKECNSYLRGKDEHSKSWLKEKKRERKQKNKKVTNPDIIRNHGRENQQNKLINKSYNRGHKNSMPKSKLNSGESVSVVCEEKQKNTAEKASGLKDKAKRSRDDLFTVDYKSSNVSGDWVIEMAKGRAEKRGRDHQSDWLFERAQARKYHQGERSSYWSDNIPERNNDHYKIPKKKFQRVRDILNNVLPTTFTDAVRSMKSAFKELRNKVKNPSRQ